MRKDLTVTEDQGRALDKIKTWFKQNKYRNDVLILSGYAGTGKSTLLSWVRDHLGLTYSQIVFSSFTGKATNVLAQNGLRAKTLHRLLYKSYLDKKTGKYYSRLKEEGLEEKLVVIDEASMLSEKLYNDLMKIQGDICLLFVGDDAQLPPINSDFNIMKKPHIKLTKILRQAALNPIIRLSRSIRNGEDWKIDNVINDEGLGYARATDENLNESIDRSFKNDVILCSRNKDRVFLNRQIREQIHKDKKKAVGIVSKDDRLIVLDNCPMQEVFNGQLFTVVRFKKSSKHKIVIHGIEDLGSDEEMVYIHPHAFFSETPANRFDICKEHKLDFKTIGVSCDYAYCLTVHKSQGSQFDNVFLKLTDQDKWIWKDLYNRWLYTAVTRAAKNLYFL